MEKLNYATRELLRDNDKQVKAKLKADNESVENIRALTSGQALNA